MTANSVSSVQVKDRSLLKKDFKTGQLPAGKKGASGQTVPPRRALLRQVDLHDLAGQTSC